MRRAGATEHRLAAGGVGAWALPVHRHCVRGLRQPLRQALEAPVLRWGGGARIQTRCQPHGSLHIPGVSTPDFLAAEEEHKVLNKVNPWLNDSEHALGKWGCRTKIKCPFFGFDFCGKFFLNLFVLKGKGKRQ